MGDAYLAKNFEAMMASKDFKFIVVGFSKNMPLSKGSYTDENKVKILDPDLLGCDDVRTTVNHESVHGSIETLRVNQNEHGVHNLTLLFPNLSSPFTTDYERKELEDAIAKGDGRILTEVQDLYVKNENAQLTPEEQLRYLEHLDVLRHADYQPRCVMREFPVDQVTKNQILPRFNAGFRGPINYGAITIFPTGFEEISSGKLRMHGFYVADKSEKIKALVFDTRERTQNMAITYQSQKSHDGNDTPEETAVKEADAEIRANRKTFLDHFYPELVAYHKKREEREAEMLQVPAPGLRA